MKINVMSVLKWLPAIVQAVKAVEEVSSAKGKAKLDVAIGVFGTLVQSVESTIPREILNEAKVQDAIRKVMDAIVALQNVVRDIMGSRKTG